MNINCPHCSAYLTVPEQYAGQLMKCPKCSSNFTVPALPAIDQEPAFAMAQSPPAPVPPAPTPPAMPPAIPLAPEVPAFNVAPPEPAFNFNPAPATPSPAPAKAATPTPKAPTPTPKAPTPSTPPGTASHIHTLPLPSSILQWIPVGAAILLFFLQFFSWVGVYPGGVPAVTQSAWGAAFGGYDPETAADMKKLVSVVPDVDPKVGLASSASELYVLEPGVSPLMIFYMLFFIIALIVSIAVAVLPFLHLQLPPAVANLLPWKWGILAILNATILLFLGLQLLLNFGIESSVKDGAKTAAENLIRISADSKAKKVEEFDTKERKTYEARRGIFTDYLSRTIWLKLAVLLHILGTGAAALMYWMDKTGRTQVQLEAGARW